MDHVGGRGLGGGRGSTQSLRGGFLSCITFPSSQTKLEGDRVEESRGREVLPPFPNLREGAPGAEAPDGVGRRSLSPPPLGLPLPLLPSRRRRPRPSSDYLCRFSPPVAVGPCALGVGRRWQRRRRSRRPRRRQGGSACLHRLCFARF